MRESTGLFPKGIIFFIYIQKCIVGFGGREVSLWSTEDTRNCANLTDKLQSFTNLQNIL